MRIGAFDIFQKTSCPKTINILTLHWRKSMTWRFILYFDWREMRVRPGFSYQKAPATGSRQFYLRLPGAGVLGLQTQRNTWRWQKAGQ